MADDLGHERHRPVTHAFRGLFWGETWQAAQLDTPDQVTVWPEFAPGDSWALDNPEGLRRCDLTTAD